MADSSGVNFNIGCVKSRLYGPTARPPYQTTVRCSLFDLRKLRLQFIRRKTLKSELPLLRFNPLGRPDRIEIAKRAHVTLAPSRCCGSNPPNLASSRPTKMEESWPFMKRTPMRPAFPAIPQRSTLRGATISPPSALLSGGMVRDSILGRSIRVHTCAHVEGCVIMDNCDIGRHAKVRRAILGKNVRVSRKHPDRLRSRCRPGARMARD